jgi:hypothetical protein
VVARLNFDRMAANKLASQVLQPNLPAFMDPTDYPQFHLATILGHDAGRNESSAALNDFDGTPVSKLPVLRPYPLGSNPQAGEYVQLIQIGNTLGVFARQYRPSGTVVF